MTILPLAFCVLVGCFAAATAARPNILFMFADDMGSNDLGYVNPEVITPNIDRLAKSGVILKNNYVMNVCTPTRSSFMTGRYPFKTQMGHLVIQYDQPLCVPTDIKFMPEYFKDMNYNTFATGKWHLGFCQEKCLPTRRGFDHFWGYYNGEEHYTKHLTGVPNVRYGYDWRDDEALDKSVDGVHNTHLINDWVVDHLNNYDSDDPFFMYVAYTNPHTPLNAPQEYVDYYPTQPEGRREYLALVTMMDESIGNITKALKDNGFYDNTLIVFSSDNGGEHGVNANNLPYQGSKGSFYEGGLRALAFAHGPMLQQTGIENEGLFHAIDWLPTLMGIVENDAFDQAEKESRHIDGFDQSDMFLNGGPSQRNDVVFNIDMMDMTMMGQTAVRVGDWKFMWGGWGSTSGFGDDVELFYENDEIRAKAGLGPYVPPANAGEKRTVFDISPGNLADVNQILKMWRWIPGQIDSGLSLLFNLADDPYEENNLADDPAHAAKLLEMKEYVIEQHKCYHEQADELKVGREESNPSKHDGNWVTGWCEDLTIHNDS